jgi:predicted anti-sigma-YlaC factor YlaD
MCTNESFLGIIKVLRIALSVLQIAIPIILLLFGAIDLGKAVMAGDEKEIKSATSTLVKRAIAALAVFLLFMVVSTITGWVGGKEWKTCWDNAANASIDIGV